MATNENARQASISNIKDDQELKTQILTRRKSTKGKSNILKTRMGGNREKHKILKIKKVYVIVFLGKNTNMTKTKKPSKKKKKESCWGKTENGMKKRLKILVGK